MAPGSVGRMRVGRFARLVGVALPAVPIVLAVLILPGYIPLVPRVIRRHATEWFLRALLAAYAGALVLAVPGSILCAARVVRGRRGRLRRPWSARGLALCVSCLFGLVMVEAGAAGWRAWAHRMPRLPTRFEDDRGPRDTRIVVIGGSSALGHPFNPWLSTGQIVAWELEKDAPDRRYSVEILAKLGASLEDMHKALAGLAQRPDALIVYSGHNEFAAAFEEERDPWLDEEPRSAWLHPLYLASLRSAFCRMVYETISKNRLDGEPPLIGRHHLIDPPQCSPSEYAEILANFRRRLETIVAWCDRIGTLPILIIPPGNEGGLEPSRSVLPATATPVERRWVEETCRAARAAEPADPARSEALYRAIIGRAPGFAEAHFRLARLLEASGRYDEASRHYIKARDADGLIIRCPTEFQQVYREVAARHPSAILIDGPAVLRAACPQGILDDHMILDSHHPTLAGHARLAGAVVGALRGRRALGARPGDSPPIDPAACARRAGMDPEKWATACNWVRVHYERVAGYRYDPAERRARAALYVDAIARLRAGVPPEMIGVIRLALGLAEPLR